MKGQNHNQGDLKELKVKIEADVVDALENMVMIKTHAYDSIITCHIQFFNMAIWKKF